MVICFKTSKPSVSLASINIFLNRNYKPLIMKLHNKLTTASGIPFVENENSVRWFGLPLLQDYILHEKWLILIGTYSERVVHARFRAFGTFTVTHDITNIKPKSLRN
jgi:catalase